jgi:hypothetical protein
VDLMGNEHRPEAEKNLGLFLSPSAPGGGGLFTPMNSMKVGPGEPGPGDDWEFPTEPIDAAAGESAQTAQPAGTTESEPHQ